MALLLSTVDGNQITGAQARAFHQSASQGRDVVFNNYGSAFYTQQPTGFTAQVGTGMLVSDGVICENTDTLSVTMPTPTKTGTGLLVGVVNLANRTFTLKFKDTVNGLIKNNLVSLPTGTREVPLYFFQYTQTGITGWTDWRPLSTEQGTPVGTVVDFAGSTAPNGWLICDGSYVPKARYQELFEKIGTLHGSDTETMFKLPNNSGRVTVGVNTGDSDLNQVGKQGGEKLHKLTHDELPIHRLYTNGMWNGYHDNALSSSSLLASGSTWGVALPEVGRDIPHNNMQPYTVMNSIIKY